MLTFYWETCAGQVQEIVRNVIEIKQLKEELENEKKKNDTKSQELLEVNFELENEKQKNNVLFEKGRALSKCAGPVQEIVRNVIEIKQLKEELENEKKRRSHVSPASPLMKIHEPGRFASNSSSSNL